MKTETVTEIAGCIVDAVQPIYRRYKRWSEYGDLTQELWLYVQEHPDTCERLLTSGRGFLVRRLRTTAERCARKERAARSGFSPDDEVFYSVRALRELLPDALDPAATPSRQAQDVRVATSQAGYGEWEAGMADVRRGVSRLSLDDQELLRLHFLTGVDPDRLGLHYGVTTDAIYSRLARVIRRLQRQLGGPRPT